MALEYRYVFNRTDLVLEQRLVNQKVCPTAKKEPTGMDSIWCLLATPDWKYIWNGRPLSSLVFVFWPTT
jgi:hypothetical protein